MINYTDRITWLMRDLVQRVPGLGYIDLDRLLVFARYGNSNAGGPFATCHCLNLPPTEPGYYYWFDTRSGQMTRRSPYFVTRSPSVTVAGREIQYLISFALPRFCDQAIEHSRKRVFHPAAPSWIAKLDTIVHELYHIDPQHNGIRRVTRSDGTLAAGAHGRSFFPKVAAMVRQYLATADEATYDFLRCDFAELRARYGSVAGTTFRTFPSFPQRYIETLDRQPAAPNCGCIQPLPQRGTPTHYTERDLITREFLAEPAGPVAYRESVRPNSIRPLRTQVVSAPLLAATASDRPLR
jgi:hypothetical protein